MLESNGADAEDGGASTDLGVSELDSFEVESHPGLSFPSVPFAGERISAGAACVGDVGGGLWLNSFTADFDSFGYSGGSLRGDSVSAEKGRDVAAWVFFSSFFSVTVKTLGFSTLQSWEVLGSEKLSCLSCLLVSTLVSEDRLTDSHTSFNDFLPASSTGAVFSEKTSDGEILAI